MTVYQHTRSIVSTLFLVAQVYFSHHFSFLDLPIQPKLVAALLPSEKQRRRFDVDQNAALWLGPRSEALAHQVIGSRLRLAELIQIKRGIGERLGQFKLLHDIRRIANDVAFDLAGHS